MLARTFSIGAFLVALSLLATPGLAAPAASVALDTENSTCEAGRLLVTTSGISGGREYWRATATYFDIGDVVLGEQERNGPATGFTGAIDFPFLTGPVAYGIVVTLYGYQGTTPPDPATTAEFSMTYVCDTLEILQTAAGPYGTISGVSTVRAEVPMLSRPSLVGVIVLVGALGAAIVRRRHLE